MVTREEFVRHYANRCGLSDEWAALGFIYNGKHTKVAMPCGCGHETCVGWAMVTAEGIDHHLLFDAPEKLRDAYREILARHAR